MTDGRWRSRVTPNGEIETTLRTLNCLSFLESELETVGDGDISFLV